MEALQGVGPPAAGHADAVAYLGDRADVCEFVFVAGDQQHALFIAGVDRQRERHAREDDDVLQRDK